MSRLVSNVAAIGGDLNNIKVLSYDWRMTLPNLEKRDLYFTRLKGAIELLYKQQGNERVVFVCHSMGNVVMSYFLNWVQSPLGGNGGELWPDKYLKAWINIAGPLLGVTKALAPMLSGETKDTADLYDTFAADLVERLLNRTERRQLFQTFGGVATLFPKGGSGIWGLDLKNSTTASYAKRDVGNEAYSTNFTHYTVEDMIEDAYNNVDNATARRWKDSYELDGEVVKKHLQRPTSWANPLMAPLPRFPSKQFKVYCLYGTGHATERAYYYQFNSSATDPQDAYEIDKSFYMDGVANGVESSDGDGSVPLLSLGYMCRHGWNSTDRNPSKVPVVTKEFPRNIAVSNLIPRRSSESVDHVDIQGNFQVLTDILHVIAGDDDYVQDRVVSQLDAIIARIKARH
ncbi:hypothetical protein HDU91_005963 [Kappamyces sp. JEL0680]|nr:hypothetical protein HDU91_005963 [Kappamyces sp. JEL0680]